MILSGIFADSVDVYHNGTLYDALKKLVNKKTRIVEENAYTLSNLYSATINEKGFHFSTLTSLQMEHPGRSLEVKIAIAIALCRPDCKVGLTRPSKDGGVDVVVYNGHEYALIDTKESENCDSRVSEEILLKAIETHNCRIYKVPNKAHDNCGYSNKIGKYVNLISVDNLIINLCNNSIRYMYRNEIDAFVNNIRVKLANLCI